MRIIIKCISVDCGLWIVVICRAIIETRVLLICISKQITDRPIYISFHIELTNITVPYRGGKISSCGLCGCHISIKGPVRRVKTVILAISVRYP